MLWKLSPFSFDNLPLFLLSLSWTWHHPWSGHTYYGSLSQIPNFKCNWVKVSLFFFSNLASLNLYDLLIAKLSFMKTASTVFLSFCTVPLLNARAKQNKTTTKIIDPNSSTTSDKIPSPGHGLCNQQFRTNMKPCDFRACALPCHHPADAPVTSRSGKEAKRPKGFWGHGAENENLPSRHSEA